MREMAAQQRERERRLHVKKLRRMYQLALSNTASAKRLLLPVHLRSLREGILFILFTLLPTPLSLRLRPTLPCPAPPREKPVPAPPRGKDPSLPCFQSHWIMGSIGKWAVGFPLKGFSVETGYLLCLCYASFTSVVRYWYSKRYSQGQCQEMKFFLGYYWIFSIFSLCSQFSGKSKSFFCLCSPSRKQRTEVKDT